MAINQAKLITGSIKFYVNWTFNANGLLCIEERKGILHCDGNLDRPTARVPTRMTLVDRNKRMFERNALEWNTIAVKEETQFRIHASINICEFENVTTVVINQFQRKSDRVFDVDSEIMGLNFETLPLPFIAFVRVRFSWKYRWKTQAN